MIEILFIVGNRPQYVKLGILLKKIKKFNMKYKILDTGQHYDKKLSKIFFNNFNFKPDYDLKIKSGKNTEIISKIILKLSKFLMKKNFKYLVIFGDTNTTLSASIVASQLNLKLLHIESGERTFTRKNFPEEINRVISDNLSDYLVCCSKSGFNNLKLENFNKKRIFFTGDIMYDLFKDSSKKILIQKKINLSKYSLKNNEKFCICTIHRQENTSIYNVKNYLKILDNLNFKTLLFAHPRLKKVISKIKWKPKRNLKIFDPIDYFEMLKLLKKCHVVFTDSGGLKKEAFFSKRFSVNPQSGLPIWNNINNQRWSATYKPDDFKSIKNKLNNFRVPKKHNIYEFGTARSCEKIIKIIKKTYSAKEENIWIHNNS